MADPEWLRLQKIVFARYVQEKLRSSDNEEFKSKVVGNVIEDLKDGTLLVDLMEVMSGKEFPGKRLKPETMRIKIITNASEALKFVESLGIDIKTVRASAEDLVDGTEKIVMALIFQIILAYLKFDEDGDEGSADVREGLCLWLNNKVDGYNHIDPVTMKNGKIPTKVFHNGMIFNALIHKMRPRLVDYDALDPENGLANLEQALELASQFLNIDKYVTAEDILKMDELSMIVYLSDWFNGVVLLQKQDVAARRIGKLVDMTILHDGLREQYSSESSAVVAWVDAKIAELAKREFDDTLGGVRQKLADFYAYKGSEKGQYIGKKLDAIGLFNNLQNRLANNSRPVWVPAEGTSPEAMDAKFEQLGEEEIKRSVDLIAEQARQVKLHKEYARFEANAAKITAWTDEKKGYIETKEEITSVEAAQDALDFLSVYEKEQEHVKDSQLADVNKLLEQLVSERFEKSAEATATADGLKSTFDGLDSSCSEKKAHLEAALQQQKDTNDNLCKEFADSAKEFQSWLNAKRVALASSEGDLSKQMEDAQAALADTSEAEAKMADFDAKSEAVTAREIPMNPHTNLTAGDLKSDWEQYLMLLRKRIELLEEQIEEQKRGGLTVEQAQEIDQNFSYFDKDGNGFLGKKELRVCLQSLGEESKPKNIAAMMETYDTDNSGTIKKDEFVKFMKATLGDSGTEPEMIQAFKHLAYYRDSIKEVELNNVVNDKSFKTHHVEYLGKECTAKDEGYDYTEWTARSFAR